jgi:hypothetical protein
MGAIADLKGLSNLADLIDWIETNTPDKEMALELANHISSAMAGLQQACLLAEERMTTFPMTYATGEFPVAGIKITGMVLRLHWISGERICWMLGMNEQEQVIYIGLYMEPDDQTLQHRVLH